MTPFLSTDTSSPSLSSLSPEMDGVLTGVRDIMEISVAQDAKLLDILLMMSAQGEKTEERDQSITMMQSKLVTQQAIIEEIRSEQRQLVSSLAPLLESHAQDAEDTSAVLSSPIILETPEPVTPAANPERSPSVFSVPGLPSYQTTPTRAFHPSSYRSSTPIAHTNLKTSTDDDQWKAPIRTQRGSRLRRHGAFYGTPNPSPPASPQIQEEDISTARNSPADVHTPMEVTQETDTAAGAVKAAASNEGDRAFSRKFCKRCRDSDEQEACGTANRMDISSIVHTASDGSSPSVSFSFCSAGHSPARGGGSTRDGPSKRRRVSQDIVDSDAVSDTRRPIRRSLRHAMPR
ncbi:uncharacterized protein HD556DRAFT_1437650 [Suillus plorans]|uniref:Uncharacterized protein n=1 Tax=Suillus plorans TaxID=116603 RepID=A0A9P7J5T3_9AGAM|nr:uncharacterized protein HD556DRAFT_1437650 [Suillus plorans]KAG1803920.1 hypothetical protein HD556DRAFT_1437650 [Suillus plorans]